MIWLGLLSFFLQDKTTSGLGKIPYLMYWVGFFFCFMWLLGVVKIIYLYFSGPKLSFIIDNHWIEIFPPAWSHISLWWKQIKWFEEQILNGIWSGNIVVFVYDNDLLINKKNNLISKKIANFYLKYFWSFISFNTTFLDFDKEKLMEILNKNLQKFN